MHKTINQKKVAFISSGEIFGGVERFVLTLSHYFNDFKLIDPLVYLFSDGELAENLRAKGVSVEIVPRFGKYSFHNISWIKNNLKSKSVSLVHTHGYKANIIGGLSAKMAKIPAIKTEHGSLEPFSGLSAFKMRVNCALDARLTKYLFQKTVYVTHELKSKKHVVGRRGFAVIPNGMEYIETNTRRPNGKAPLTIGMVGRLSKVKGHEILFKALRDQTSHVRFKVLIFGTGPLEGHLKSLSPQMTQHEIEFKGFSENILDEMRSLDCLVMPSLHEGMPYVLLEAMHLGLPIVASRVGGIKEVLTHEKNALLFEPGNVRELRQMLDRLSSQPELASQLGDAAKMEARAHYGLAGMAEAYLGIYRDVLP